MNNDFIDLLCSSLSVDVLPHDTTTEGFDIDQFPSYFTLVNLSKERNDPEIPPGKTSFVKHPGLQRRESAAVYCERFVSVLYFM